MGRVEHDGRATAYRDSDAQTGQETDLTVLYVHGSGATHRVWGYQYGARGTDRRAAALDLSGHGDSDDIDTAPGAATLDAYAADVVAVARDVDADVVVGNSLGGAVAQWVALETSWTPKALVLTGTGPSLPVYEDLREWLASDFEHAIEFLHGRDRLFHDTDHDAVEQSRDQMRAVGRRVTHRDFLTCHAFDATDRLGEIDVPVLALCGEHDKLTPREYHERLARDVPQGEVALVPDAAHLAMVERPTVFAEIVAGFLDSVAES